MRICLWIFLCLLFLNLSGQRNKEIHGYLNDKYTFNPIEGALITSDDTTFNAHSDSRGFYTIVVPTHTYYLYVQHEKYVSERIRLHGPVTGVNIRMSPLLEYKVDYGELQGKNSISWLPLKLIWGALGLRYERFLGAKFSLGLYADWYYKGKQYFGEEEYTGFKATPTFRYYIIHHKATGFYLQASAILGYFDFSVLNYIVTYYPEDSYSVTENFWTGGAGMAIGGCFAYGKGRKAMIDMNIGFQFMPANYPMTVITSYGKRYEHTPTWWYVGAPGSIIEIKIGIGGIF